MPDLQELILYQNNIKGNEMSVLLTKLQECKNLRTLDLSDNYLSEEHINLLIDLIKVNPFLESLRIGDSNITEEGS